MRLHLHLTSSCNLRCSYCFTPPAYSEPMSEAVAFRALDLGWREAQGPLSVVFTGGEPLLAKGLIQSIVHRGREMAQQGGPKIAFRVVTNGLLLDEPFLTWAAAQGVRFGMSYDGVQAAQDAHRLLPDRTSSWALVQWRLRQLLHGDRRAAVLLTLTPQTVGHLERSVAELLRAGARYLVVTPSLADAWGEAALEVLGQQLEGVARRYLERARKGKAFYFSPFELHCTQTDPENPRCIYHYPPLEVGVDVLAVDPAGFVFPGSVFVAKGPASRWCLGDVFGGISERLRRQISAEARAFAQRDELPIRGLSATRCASLRWISVGSFDALGEAALAYDAVHLPIADRVRASMLEEGLRPLSPEGEFPLEEQLSIAGPF
ncbi:MAG: radical SAM protein [Deltaproteobacteria bacterium]|nr:radical SAM protein [Deltaproteobacteria bacterium]